MRSISSCFVIVAWPLLRTSMRHESETQTTFRGAEVCDDKDRLGRCQAVANAAGETSHNHVEWGLAQLGESGGDEVTGSMLNWKITARGPDRTVVLLYGEITESVTFGELMQLRGRVAFDLAGVRRINSFGVRELLNFL